MQTWWFVNNEIWLECDFETYLFNDQSGVCLYQSIRSMPETDMWGHMDWNCSWQHPSRMFHVSVIYISLIQMCLTVRSIHLGDQIKRWHWNRNRIFCNARELFLSLYFPVCPIAWAISTVKMETVSDTHSIRLPQ